MNDSKEKFTLWINEYADEFFRYSISKVSNQEAAEDIVQNTFLAGFQAISNFKNESSPKTWLYSILKNKIKDYHRLNYQRNEVKSLENDKDPFLNYFFNEEDHWKMETQPQIWSNSENLLDNTDFNSMLKNCIEKLPAKWQSAIQMKYLDDRDANLICQELKITPSNYWQVLHRAKLQLRECLDTHWFKNE